MRWPKKKQEQPTPETQVKLRFQLQSEQDVLGWMALLDPAGHDLVPRTPFYSFHDILRIPLAPGMCVAERVIFNRKQGGQRVADERNVNWSPNNDDSIELPLTIPEEGGIFVLNLNFWLKPL